MSNPSLYIVATPIGNLEDLSIRAKNILTLVDAIAAEDTRETKKLLSLIGVSYSNKKFIAYEDHFEQKKTQEIIDLIKEGKSVALVSDAGSPLISDPGYKLIRECRKQDIKITTIPGCCAVILALQLSGLPTNRFMFAGFVPNKDKARDTFFRELKDINSTIVVYETAVRILKTLYVIKEILPSSEVSIVREITKMYEECLRGTAQELFEHYQNNTPKGEIVVMVSPPTEDTESGFDIETELKSRLGKMSLKSAVKEVAQLTKSNKNEIYDIALRIKNED